MIFIFLYIIGFIKNNYTLRLNTWLSCHMHTRLE